MPTPHAGSTASTPPDDQPVEAASVPPPQGSIYFYLVLTTLTAAAGLAVEIIAGRMIAPYLGMSLYTWTAIIAVVLAGFSIGHWIGGNIAEWNDGARSERAVAWALLAASATTAVSLPLIRVLAGPVISADMGAVPTILILTALLFFAPSLFVGIPSPVLTKRAIDIVPHNMGRILGIFYAAGAFGSILGTLLAGYVLISWLGTTMSLLAISALYLAMAFALFWQARTTARAALIKPAAATLVLLALILPAGLATAAFRSNCNIESQYYCIRIDDISASLGTQARVMVLDHLAHGINVHDNPAALVSPYVAMQNALVETQLPSQGARMRAFFVGGGAYTLPRAWATTHPAAHITVAELDPAVTRAARQNMWLGSPENLVVDHHDARTALAAAPAASFGVIVGDAFHDIAVPPHLVTAEFIKLVRSRLAPGGIYVMNVVDNAQRPRFALSVIATLQTIFPVVELWADATPDPNERRATFVIAALARPSPASQITLGSESTWRRWPAPHLKKLMSMLDAMVLTDDFAPVDRLIGVE